MHFFYSGIVFYTLAPIYMSYIPFILCWYGSSEYNAEWFHKEQKKYKKHTLQGINISHFGKRKIIFKMPFFGGYVSSLEGILIIFWLLHFSDAVQVLLSLHFISLHCVWGVFPEETSSTDITGCAANSGNTCVLRFLDQECGAISYVTLR